MTYWARRTLSAVNILSTALTLLTGIRENALISFFTGQFRLIRSQLQNGHTSYDIARLDHLSVRALPDLVAVSSEFDFHYAPTRSQSNLGEDRSVCRRVNSMSASSLALHYDDAFGTGPRREQVFLYSVTAPHCKVINLEPQWLTRHCIEASFQGNATACHAHIASNFERLAEDTTIQVGIPVDFGTVGQPFLKCVGRPREPFKYGTDLLVLQSFWAGQQYHVEVQSSVCWARPTLIKGLFHVEAADQQAKVVVAVPPVHWVLSFIPVLYAVVTLVMIVRGLSAIFLKRREVPYVSAASKGVATRSTRRLTHVSVSLAVLLQPIRQRVEVVRFLTTKTVVGSNLWMNHWLFISVSIMDSVVCVRTVYAIQEMGTWMLTKQVSLENFFFICSALTRLTWLTCLLHTLLRGLLTTGLRILNRVLLSWTNRHSRACEGLIWYINGVALLINFKIYSVLLVLQLYTLLHVHGSTTLMGPADPLKRPVYGGYADLAGMWGSEIACDLLVVFSIQIAAAHVLGSLLLLTPLRHVTHSQLLQILQCRYVFVGWDSYVAMEALGIDPFRPVRKQPDEKGHAAPSMAVCSIAALTRQLYASGPSGWVCFAGDAALIPGAQQAGHLQYPLAMAASMGFIVPADRFSSQETTATSLSDHHTEDRQLALRSRVLLSTQPQQQRRRHSATVTPLPSTPSVGLRERVLHMHVESRWGAVVLVDHRHAPGYVTSRVDDSTDGGVFVVRDALHQLEPQELTAVVKGELKLCIR